MSSKSFDWDEFLAEVAKRIPPQQYRAWLEPAQLISVDSSELVLGAPTNFSRDWVQDHYQDVFSEVIRELFDMNLNIRVEVQAASPVMEMQPEEAQMPENGDNSASSPGSQTNAQDSELPLFGGLFGESPAPVETQPPTVSAESTSALPKPAPKNPIAGDLRLDPKHTFETFVVGASNQFAHAAARAVAEQPASQYNPLFLYSEAGLGKTHLLHAIGNHLLKANPRLKICYIPAEKFVNDLIESIRHEKMANFRARYRDGFDLLLMDDIQFIAGKDRTQEEFFHTFNVLHASKRQIVVTSDKLPKDIPGLEERISTRFGWGLIADIQAPEIETRIAILRAKAELDDVFLPNDVALFLASNIKSNIRELEGALIRLGAQASLSGAEISLEMAKRELKNQIKEPTVSISVDVVLDVVSKHFGLKVADLKGKERSKRVSQSRQIAMFLIRKYCGKSYPEIGILLGGKDHSTVVHGVKTIVNEIETTPDIRRHVESIQNML